MTELSEPGGAVTIEQYRNKTANVGAKATVAGTFTVSLGVTRKTDQVQQSSIFQILVINRKFIIRIQTRGIAQTKLHKYYE